jgi:hypothetical protein
MDRRGPEVARLDGCIGVEKRDGLSRWRAVVKGRGNELDCNVGTE